jgi:hypothetical protein
MHSNHSSRGPRWRAWASLGLLAVATIASSAVGVALAASPSAYVREILRLEAPGQASTPIRCVATSELARRGGKDGATALGVTILRGDSVERIMLSYPRVCKPIARYRETRRLFTTTATAVMTVLHEAAHARGIKVEWKAECAAIPGTLRVLRRWGASPYQLRQVERYVRVGAEKYRRGPYKLRGRC